MIQMRYKNGYYYVFEGPRPGTVGIQIQAFEAEVVPGRWETIAPFAPDPLNPAFTMGKRWLAKSDDASTPIVEEQFSEFKAAATLGAKNIEDDLRARYERVEAGNKEVTDDLTEQLAGAQVRIAELESALKANEGESNYKFGKAHGEVVGTAQAERDESR